MSELQAGWMLSLVLGARHALEPDHVAAVTTLITTERGRPAALGMWWGVGHALALFLVATALSLLQRQLSTEWADRCELLVAAMLIVLGVRAVYLVWAAVREGGQGRLHFHAHGDANHAHLRISDSFGKVYCHGLIPILFKGERTTFSFVWVL